MCSMAPKVLLLAKYCFRLCYDVGRGTILPKAQASISHCSWIPFQIRQILYPYIKPSAFGWEPDTEADFRSEAKGAYADPFKSKVAFCQAHTVSGGDRYHRYTRRIIVLSDMGCHCVSIWIRESHRAGERCEQNPFGFSRRPRLFQVPYKRILQHLHTKVVQWVLDNWLDMRNDQ